MGDIIVKIRNGFVSNSSSSSFIIAFRKDYATRQCCPTCGSVTNIFKIIDIIAEKSNETCITARDVEEILNIHSSYVPYLNDLKQDISEFFEDKNPMDYELIELKIDYRHNFLKDFIHADKNFTIITEL